MENVIPGIQTPYQLFVCAFGSHVHDHVHHYALAFTFMMTEVRADAAHAHDHVSTQSTIQ